MLIENGFHLGLSMKNNEHIDVYYKLGQPPEICRFIYRKENGTQFEIAQSNIKVNGARLTELSDFKWYIIESADTASYTGNTLEITATQFQRRKVEVKFPKQEDKKIAIAVPVEVKNNLSEGYARELLKLTINKIRCAQNSRELDSCIPVLDQTLEMQIRAKGEEHISVAEIHFNIGSLYCSLGGEDYIVFAKASFEKALKIFENHYPKDHAFLVPALYNLVFICKDLNEQNEAKAYWQRLKEPKFMYGKYSNANPINTLVNACKKIDLTNYSNFSLLENSIKSFKDLMKKYPENSLEYASCSFNLASLFYQGNEFQGASEQLENVRKLLGKYGQNSPYMMATFCNAQFLQYMNSNIRYSSVFREDHKEIVDELNSYRFFESLSDEIELFADEVEWFKKEKAKEQVNPPRLTQEGVRHLSVKPSINTIIPNENPVPLPILDLHQPNDSPPPYPQHVAYLDQSSHCNPFVSNYPQYPVNYPMNPYGYLQQSQLAQSWPLGLPYPLMYPYPYGSRQEAHPSHPSFNPPPYEPRFQAIVSHNPQPNSELNAYSSKDQLLSVYNSHVIHATQAYKDEYYVSAAQLTNLAMEQLVKVGLENHISMSELYFNRGVLFYYLKLHVDAENYFAKSLEIQERHFGIDHVYLDCNLYFLTLLNKHFDHKEKESVYRARLNSPKSLRGMSETHLQIEQDFKEAYQLYQKAVSLFRNPNPENAKDPCFALSLEKIREVNQAVCKVHGEGSPYVIGLILQEIDLIRLSGKSVHSVDFLGNHMFFSSITMD